MDPTPAKVNRFALQLSCGLLGTIGLVAYALSKFVNGQLIVLIAVAGLLGFVLLLVNLVRRQTGWQAGLKVLGVTTLIVLADTYLILFLVVHFYQNRIASEIPTFFQPQGLSAQAAQSLISPQVEALELTTPDGALLRGWLVHNPGNNPAPLIIYFGGSGSEASQMIPTMQGLAGWSVVLVNYRGFGQSEGTPSQAQVFADATLIYDTLASRPDVDARRIVAMGYSLGTGVAVHLAGERPVQGVVLVAPFDRLSLIGLKPPLIYRPLAGIMRPYFDSLSLAPTISSPLLCLIGSADANVPPELSLRLAGRWGGETTVITYPGEDHGLLMHANDIWADIQYFIDSL